MQHWFVKGVGCPYCSCWGRILIIARYPGITCTFVVFVDVVVVVVDAAVVVLTLARIVQSVVTGQSPVTLDM